MRVYYLWLLVPMFSLWLFIWLSDCFTDIVSTFMLQFHRVFLILYSIIIFNVTLVLFWYRISRTYWLFLAPENAPFWSIQVPKAFLELKGALNAHILDFSGARNCTFLEFLGTWYLRGLFGVKRGLKLTHLGIFWPLIMYLFGVFREAILAFPGTRKCTFL